ncbi:MAG TPA: DUF899 domain-containing protein [Solirubrobacteraceae bacterium]|jgi:predicted dithiol-disulfide oxidoreductase (DUF899 family)|nr:DUF899 domain-containing protein [Solirubrobacteraceae bacterium]
MAIGTEQDMTVHATATRAQWDAARADLLEREKELTRLGDELARDRRELPWVAVKKRYTLETADGPKTLADLFDGRSQLLIYHFMFGSSYEQACPTNSSIADAVNGLLPHLQARDVTLILVSGAPVEKLISYRQRMGWDLNWASSYGSDFDLELGFSSTEDQTRAWVESPQSAGLPAIAHRNARASGTDLVGYLTEGFGFNAFALVGETVYQTYSTTGRGVEFLMTYYGVLDRAPMGRNEGEAFQMWIQRRDEYSSEQGPGADHAGYSVQ